jgi:hypothetical protein
MNSALCRRDFVTRGLVLAGAALLLPAQRLSAAATTSGSPSTATGAAPGDAAHRSALALVARYGTALDVSRGENTTRIAVRIRCFDAMVGALSGAKAQGISRLSASGNTVAFDLGGRRFELENLHHAV